MATFNDIRFAELYDLMEEVALEHEMYEMMPFVMADGRALDSLWKGAKEADRIGWRLLVDAATRRALWKVSEINTLA